MTKNLIVAGFNNQNLGDDLMFATVVNNLKYDNYYFYGPILKPAFVEQPVAFIKYGRAVPLRWKFFADFALIGGSLFMGENDVQMEMFKWKLKLLKLNKLFGGKNFVLGANLGPYRDENEYFTSLKKVISLVDCWKVRDKVSYELLKKLNARNVELIPDIVMGFDTEPYENKPTKKVLAISVTDVDKDGAVDLKQHLFEAEIVYLIEKYHTEGFSVDLLSFEDSKDLPIMQRIAHQVSKDVVVRLVENKGDAVLASLAGAEVVISTRFHCMVLSALLRKSQIIYRYSSKTLNFANIYGFKVSEISGDASTKAPSPTSFPTKDVISARSLFNKKGILNEN